MTTMPDLDPTSDRSEREVSALLREARWLPCEHLAVATDDRDKIDVLWRSWDNGGCRPAVRGHGPYAARRATLAA